MRKILSLALMFLLSINIFAQEEIDFAQKTRYIYLWDVTYSTVDWGKREMCDNISSFLIKDISSKQKSNDEIIIVPFNDKIIESNIIRHTAKEFNTTYSNERDALKETGYDWAYNEHGGHKTCECKSGKKYKDCHGKNIPVKTNVAVAVKYARENYATDTNYNNIIILLTDGYNEYTEDGEIVSPNDLKAKNYLRKEIRALDEVITKNVNDEKYLSVLLYVILKDTKVKDGKEIVAYDDPRDGDSEGYLRDLGNTRFIMPNQSSININLVELAAEMVEAKGGDGYHMNLRDTKFRIQLEGEGLDVLKKSGKKLKIRVESRDKDLLDYDKICEINYFDYTVEANNVEINSKNIESDCEIPISIELANSKEFEEDTENYIKVWLKTIKTLKLKVTRKFKPQITIRVKE